MRNCRLAFLLSCLAVGAALAQKSMFCPALSEEVKLDGVLDDTAWSKAWRCDGMDTSLGGQAPDARTCIRLFLQGQRLFLAAELGDHDPSRLETRRPRRDDIVWDQTLEVFLAPEGSSGYCHVAFTPGGGLYDNIAFGLATDYDYDIGYAVKKHQDHWTVEASLPLNDMLNMKGMRPGDHFRINVCRHAADGFRDKAFSWTPTGSSFHNGSAFGHCHLGSPADHLKRQQTRLKALRAELGKGTLADGRRPAIEKELESLERQSAVAGQESEVLQLMAGVEALERRIRTAALPRDRLIVAREDPWRLPSSEVLRPVERTLRKLTVLTLANEHRELALSIGNPTAQPVGFRVEPTHFRRWGEHPMRLDGTADFLKVRLAQAVGIQGGAIQRDALVEFGTEHEVTVPPLANAVIFLEVAGSRLEPGEYDGAVAIKPLIHRHLACSIPLTIKVAKTSLDMTKAPYSCNWATYQAKACRDRQAAFRDQREHGTNVHIVKNEHTGITSARFDRLGRLLPELLDFSQLDPYVEAFGTGRQLYVMHFNSSLPHPRLRNVENLKAYLQALMGHLRKRGLTRRNLAWYQVDEPDMERADQAIGFYKLLLAADPEQQVFCTAYSSTPVEVLRKLAAYVSIWVVSYNTRPVQLEAIRRASVRPVRWFSYEVLGRSTHPLTYRRSGHLAMKLGYEGIGFWSYDDAGNGSDCSTWNDFERPDRSAYAVVYEGTRAPQVSVRWQAWRQTIQDYACMKTIQELASRCDRPTLKRSALELVENAVETVCARREQADECQASLRRMLLRLSGEAEENPDLLTEDGIMILTGNDPAAPAAAIEGAYAYDPPPNSWQDVCGTASTPIPFPGKGKTHRPGKLIDGSVQFPHSWVKWNDPRVGSKAVVFDFKRPWQVVGLTVMLDLFIESHDYSRLSVLGSLDGRNWSRLERLNLMPVATVPRELDEQVPISLKPHRCRFLKIELATQAGRGTLGEVRIYGRR